MPTRCPVLGCPWHACTVPVALPGPDRTGSRAASNPRWPAGPIQMPSGRRGGPVPQPTLSPSPSGHNYVWREVALMALPAVSLGSDGSLFLLALLLFVPIYALGVRQ